MTMRLPNAKIFVGLLLSTGFGLCGSPPASAAVIDDSFPDYASWVAAVGGTIVTEQFDTDPGLGYPTPFGYPGSNPEVNAGNPTTVSFVSGLVSDGNNLSDHQCNGSNSFFGSFLGCLGVAGDTLTWTLPFSTRGFSGSFLLDVSGLSNGLSAVLLFDQGGSATVDVADRIGNHGLGFYGVVSDLSFSALRWEALPDGTTFEVDDFAISRPAQVPEPGIAPLLGIALAGLWFTRRSARDGWGGRDG